MLNIGNFIRFCSVVLFLVLLVDCISSSERNVSIEFVVEEEKKLTEQYGQEVSFLVENFEMRTGSFEGHYNNDMLIDTATGDYLEHLMQSNPDMAPYWLIVTNVEIKHIRVIEYQPEEIKTIACMVRDIEERTPKTGEWIKSYGPNKICKLYVFSLVNNKWKVAATFNTTNPNDIAHDWTYAPEWLKEVIGELPHDPSMLREQK